MDANDDVQVESGLIPHGLALLHPAFCKILAFLHVPHSAAWFADGSGVVDGNAIGSIAIGPHFWPPQRTSYCRASGGRKRGIAVTKLVQLSQRTAAVAPPQILSVVASGMSVIRQEAAALLELANQLDERFDAAIRILVATRHRIIVTGIGKSGYVARKIAATLAATGAPAFFIHPAEAAHGDLGMLMPGDSLLAFSNSGSTPELSPIFAYAASLSIPIVSITSRTESPLAMRSTICLCLPDIDEACPVKIAPTTSTTMMLALGDAIAVAIMGVRGVSAHDISRLHPGGNIGKRLMSVDRLIQKGSPLPLVRPDTRMRDVILEMTSVGKGVAGVVDHDGCLVGIVTDGDLRREFDRIIIATARDIMTRSPVTIASGTTVEKAYRLLNDARITVAFVMDRERLARPVGLIHIHDLAFDS